MSSQNQQDDLALSNDENKSDSNSASTPKIEPKQNLAKISIPAEAEDTDLIEKEWVDRAKEIVEHTRDNPYEQQNALTKMKTDYMKKRYNRDVKSTEE